MTTSLPPISNEDIMSVLKEAYPELFARRFWETARQVIWQINNRASYPGFFIRTGMRENLDGVYCVCSDERHDPPRELPSLVIKCPPTFYKATPDIESYIEKAVNSWMESI